MRPARDHDHAAAVNAGGDERGDEAKKKSEMDEMDEMEKNNGEKSSKRPGECV